MASSSKCTAEITLRVSVSIRKIRDQQRGSVGQAGLQLGAGAPQRTHYGADSGGVEPHVEAAAYVYVCEKLVERFPNLQTVAITLRGSLSASHNTWSGILWHGGETYTAPKYDIVPSWTGWAAATAFAAV